MMCLLRHRGEPNGSKLPAHFPDVTQRIFRLTQIRAGQYTLRFQDTIRHMFSKQRTLDKRGSIFHPICRMYQLNALSLILPTRNKFILALTLACSEHSMEVQAGTSIITVCPPQW